MQQVKRLAIMLVACVMLFGTAIAQPTSVEAANTTSGCCGATRIDPGASNSRHVHWISFDPIIREYYQNYAYRCARCGTVWIYCSNCGYEFETSSERPIS